VDAAVEHLRAADPVLSGVIDVASHVSPTSEPRSDRPSAAEHYASLVRTIVAQQLSTRAASAIWTRLTDHFGGRAPTPEELLAADPEALRAAAGLSRAKVVYLRSLAEHVRSGELELERLHELADDTVIAELTAVKGLGEWSAHMFLIFALDRPDVLATGDLGIRRAIQVAYGLAELPTATEVARIATLWRPYRSTACRYLWRSLDPPSEGQAAAATA
jgi:DNA-3-methyladenine glycosylase II